MDVDSLKKSWAYFRYKLLSVVHWNTGTCNIFNLMTTFEWLINLGHPTSLNAPSPIFFWFFLQLRLSSLAPPCGVLQIILTAHKNSAKVNISARYTMDEVQAPSEEELSGQTNMGPWLYCPKDNSGINISRQHILQSATLNHELYNEDITLENSVKILKLKNADMDQILWKLGFLTSEISHILPLLS